MPDLKKIVNQDPQLARRLYPVEIDRLHPISDVEPVLHIVRKYAMRAKIGTQECVQNDSFAMRLMHAADYEFGLMAEIIVQAVAKALLSDGLKGQLRLRHFADVFFDRSAALDALNPFIAEDYVRINPRRIFETDEEAYHVAS